jgi:ABC-type lipoprotein export system ATPase subunit
MAQDSLRGGHTNVVGPRNMARMDRLGILLTHKVKRLSGGQQAQVALTMALAKEASPLRCLRALALACWRG